MLPSTLTKRLVNHARPNDVTEGYAADWTVAQLREPAQRIADRIETLARRRSTVASPLLRPFTPRRVAGAQVGNGRGNLVPLGLASQWTVRKMSLTLTPPHKPFYILHLDHSKSERSFTATPVQRSSVCCNGKSTVFREPR